MPANESATLIVARFLKFHGYDQSYQAFIKEANLPEDAGVTSTPCLTLEKLLEEKRLFDQSVNFEKLSLTEDVDQGWAPGAPNRPTIIQSLPFAANLLNTIATEDKILASTSDRRISTVGAVSLDLISSWTGIQDSPVLSQLVFQKSFHISASMSGNVLVASMDTGHVLERRKDHAKYVVGLAVSDGAHPMLASAGWDNVVNIYVIDRSGEVPRLGEPAGKISLPTKPESLLFVKHPDTEEPVLVLTRTDSSYLHFYSPRTSALLGRQNLAPHSNAWVAFTPTSMALCPTESSTIAIATNSVPHMKVIVVKLLLPSQSEQAQPAPQTAREEAVAEQRVADREHNAIKLHCNAMSSQTPYSTPLVVWRPGGRGVWVNSDDGVIRGIDVLSGKVSCELRHHEPGTKVRTLWAGEIAEEEVLVSGGFDHKLVIWRA